MCGSRACCSSRSASYGCRCRVQSGNWEEQPVWCCCSFKLEELPSPSSAQQRSIFGNWRASDARQFPNIDRCCAEDGEGNSSNLKEQQHHTGCSSQFPDCTRQRQP